MSVHTNTMAKISVLKTAVTFVMCISFSALWFCYFDYVDSINNSKNNKVGYRDTQDVQRVKLEERRSDDKNINKNNVCQITNVTLDDDFNKWSQYESGVKKIAVETLKELPYITVHRPSKKTPSRLNPSNFDIAFSKCNVSNVDSVILTMDVKNATNGSGIPGCSFYVEQYFTLRAKKHKALCQVGEMESAAGVYKIQCVNHGGSECITVKVFLDYCLYEAFSDHVPRIQQWRRKILSDEYCFFGVVSSVKQLEKITLLPAKWSIDQNGHCEHLTLRDGNDLRIYDASQACKCIEKFDDVYVLGTSHIRFFADYLMHYCHNYDFQAIICLPH